MFGNTDLHHSVWKHGSLVDNELWAAVLFNGRSMKPVIHTSADQGL